MALIFPDIYADFSGMGIVIEGAVVAIVFVLAIIGGIIFGIIGGIIFGSIYAALYNSLPGSTSVIKGIVLAIIFWIIFSILLGYGTLTVNMELYVINNVIIGIIAALFWGFLLGKFWDKYGKPSGA